MAKQILTVEQLIAFCKENNFGHFSSKESNGDTIVVKVPMTVTFAKDEDAADNEDASKKGFLPVKLYVSHTGKNDNGSHISKESAENAAPSLAYRPILANIIKLDDGSYDFHAHDYKNISEDERVFIETPIGVITADNPTLEYNKEKDRYYTVVKGFVYAHYNAKAVEIIESKDTVKVSSELYINEMTYNFKENYLDLTDFYYNGITLLGSEKDGTPIEEGMEGSHLEIEDFCFSKTDLEALNEKVNALEKQIKEFAMNTNDNKKGEQRIMNEALFNELLAKYNKKADEITFEYKELSDADLKAKFAAEFGKADTNPEANVSEDSDKDASTNGEEDNHADGTESSDATSVEPTAEGEGTTDTEASQGSEQNFALSLNDKISKVRNGARALMSQLYDDEWKYDYLVFDGYVICKKYDSAEYTKIAYTEDKASETVTFSNDSEQVFVEFLNAEEKGQLTEMRENYSNLKSTVEKYEAAKASEEKKAIIEEDQAYSKFKDTKLFKKLISEADKYSVDEFKTQAELTFAKCVKEAGSYTKDETKSVIPVHGIPLNFSKEAVEKPYGGIFEENGIA